MSQNDVRSKRGQFRRVSANVAFIGGSPAGVDPHIATDAPAQLLQPLQERPDTGLKFHIVRSGGQDYADEPHPLGLLRAHRERPRCRRAAEQRNELAPPDHSITSSARVSNVVGTSRPSVLAVLRLITSSYLVGACTGRSAGFSPLRMRSTYCAACRKSPTRSGP